ncbi:Uncharacterized protein C2F7.02c [Grifola frondosa]|uniref:Uncharacterized protein C2F7.02c n=1 Tax=Grifola frondosa TaxID=5627 RepID=A0A1C7M2Q7_GRIFR|nr:Uncharacterized protein C2F7.02c [Grifola frondosa]
MHKSETTTAVPNMEIIPREHIASTLSKSLFPSVTYPEFPLQYHMATATSPDATGTQGKEVHSEPANAEGTPPQNGSEKSVPADQESVPNDAANGSATGGTPSAGPPHDDHPGQDPPQHSSSSRLPPPSGKDKPEADKDKGSIDTTLTGTHARRKDVSDVAHTTSSTAEPESPRAPTTSRRARKKRSLLSKLLHALVPCVGPSRVHTIWNSKSPRRVQQDRRRARLCSKRSKWRRRLRRYRLPRISSHEPSTSTQPGLSADEEASTSAAPPSQDIPPPLAPLIIPEQPSDPAVIDETEGVTSGAVQPPGSTGEESLHEHTKRHSRDSADESDGSTSFTEDEELEEVTPMDEAEDDEERLIMNGERGSPLVLMGAETSSAPFVAQTCWGKCLVLDLDETLVHSSFKVCVDRPSPVIVGSDASSSSQYSRRLCCSVEIEYHWHNVYVIKRPGVDNFLKRMGEIYEVVVFTASLSKYADPVLDKLDIHHVVSHRLFRESCYNHRGNYVKDLSQLGRPISDTIIIDNSPASYIFHPNNAVPVSSWFNDPHDTELTDLCPFLSDLGQVDDVRGVLDGGL